MRDLPHVLSRVFGAAHLVAPSGLAAVASAVTSPNRSLWYDDGNEKAAPDCGYTVVDGVAVVPVIGTMVRRGGWLSAACGMASYDGLAAVAAQAFADPSAHAVLLDLDTPGGEAGGVFDLADMLTSLRASTGKPLWAMANEAALSAGYALACVADRIILPRTGEVGSIGVVCAHVDRSGMDRAEGLAWTYIHAGAHKVDGHPHAPLPPSVRADLQADIDRLYGLFVDHVTARRRGLSRDAVIATQARVYRGADALAVGLADQIGTRDAAISDLSALARRAVPAGGPSRPFAGAPKKEPVTMAAASETAPLDTDAPAETDAAEGLGDTLPAPDTPAPPNKDAPEAVAAAAVTRADAARMVTLAQMAARHGVTVDAAAALAGGVSLEAFTARVMDAIAARADTTAVSAAAPVDPVTGGSAPPATRKAQVSAWATKLNRK